MVELPRPLVRGGTGVVACGHPLGVAAGLKAFDEGGGAVDAAVATAAVLTVVLPDACGLGGDAMLLVRSGDAEVAFNGSGAAPAELCTPIPEDGAATAAVPGVVAAWEDAVAGFGRLPLEQVLAPAVRLASDGFPAGEALLEAVGRQRERLALGADGWELLEPSLAPGALVRQTRLADLLALLGREGARAFYEGETAEAIVRRVAADGGTLALSDLAVHRTVVRAPVKARYLGVRLSLQPPVSQALLAGMVLAELEQAGEEAQPHRLHRAVEAVEAAFVYRDELVAPEAEERLLRETRLEIDPAEAARRGGPRGNAHTTAVTTADADGTVVSMLVSVFDDFGSAGLVPEGGFILNDRMTGFSSDPASPNAAAAGRRPVHTLSPALLDDGARVFGLATPGADGQVQTLVQLIDALARDGLSIPEAFGLPRWRSVDGRLAVEESLDQELVSELELRGHSLWRLPDGHELFGAAAAAGIDRRTGTLFAAADPRRDTWAGGW